MHRVQLSSTAVVFIGLLAGSSPPNQKLTSLLYEPYESAPWHAFFVPSVPYRFLIVPASASAELVEPRHYLHLATAPGETSSIPITTSLQIKDSKFG